VGGLGQKTVEAQTRSLVEKIQQAEKLNFVELPCALREGVLSLEAVMTDIKKANMETRIQSVGAFRMLALGVSESRI